MTPDPNSVAIMRNIDNMSPAMRLLVHEFGYVIVRDMIADGYDDAANLRQLLEVWRCRRQDQWLATNHVTKKTAESIVNAAMFRSALRQAA